MFFVFDPYNEKAKKRQGKFINLDDHIKEWLSYFVKKYLNLTILRSAVAVLVLILLMQLAPAAKSLPAGAQINPANSVTLDHFAFNTISSPQTAGTPFPITITAQDQYNNTVASFNGTCDLTDLTGTISPTTTGNFVHGVLHDFNLTITGARLDDNITATKTGSIETGTSNNFDVIHNPTIASITVSPDSYTATAGDGVTYIAQANDVYGNFWDVTPATAFSIIEPGHGGSWLNNAYTTHTSGTWTVQGTYLGMISKATLNVIHAVAKSIKITPDPYTATAGDSVVYYSKAKDAYANTWGATAETSFTINKEASGNWTANIYKSAKEGLWTVTGTYITNPAITDTAFLRINPKLPITPKSQSIQGEVAGAEIGIASSIGPKATKPEVLAESTTGTSWFTEVPFPFKSSSAVGFPSRLIISWSRNIGILLVILGILIILTSFLGWFGFLPALTKPVQKTLWDRK